MALNFILLFFTALLAGLLVFVTPALKEKYFKLVLVFAGSYLFSITILHILPELFSGSYNPSRMGVYILIGFLLQQLLEFGLQESSMATFTSTSLLPTKAYLP